MSHDHHDHSHHHPVPDNERRVLWAALLTGGFMFAEVIGGWLSNSLALLADAGHMFTDVAAMSLTLAAIWFASRPATPKKTYGYYRLEILSAFVNGVALALISLYVVYEAIHRISDPPEVRGWEMTVIAVGGLVVNIVCASLLHGDHNHDRRWGRRRAVHLDRGGLRRTGRGQLLRFDQHRPQGGALHGPRVYVGVE